MSVVGRKDLNVINPPDSGESFFYSLSASDTLILDIPAGKTICYFVPFSSTNIFYTYSKDTTDPPLPDIATADDGIINSHLLPNALVVGVMTKIRLAPLADVDILSLIHI